MTGEFKGYSSQNCGVSVRTAARIRELAEISESPSPEVFVAKVCGVSNQPCAVDKCDRPLLESYKGIGLKWLSFPEVLTLL